jgi:hypothetical protein
MEKTKQQASANMKNLGFTMMPFFTYDANGS